MDYTLKEYQADAKRTLNPSGSPLISDYPLAYAALGLNAEAGECANVVKKTWHDGGVLTTGQREDLIEEAGDVLWYLAILADALDLSLDVIAHSNIAKLQHRHGT